MWKIFKIFKKKISVTKTTITKAERIAEEELLIIAYGLLSPEKYRHLYEFKNSRDYWTNFIVAVCFAESGYNRFERYTEPAPLFYESLGLLQLSYIDQTHYKFCDLAGNKIFNEKNNIECGIGILNNLVGKKGNPIFNNGHYWAVLKPENKRHIVFKNKFAQLQSGE